MTALKERAAAAPSHVRKPKNDDGAPKKKRDPNPLSLFVKEVFAEKRAEMMTVFWGIFFGYCLSSVPGLCIAMERIVHQDVMGVVFSYLGTKEQAVLRSVSTALCEAFDRAVWHEGFITAAASQCVVKSVEELGSAKRWAPLALSSRACSAYCDFATGFPFFHTVTDRDKKGKVRGTVFVNIKLLLGENQVALPERFLAWCPAQSILYVQGENIITAGSGWMKGTKSLKYTNFDSFTALRDVGSEWLAGSGVSHVSFDALRNLERVGSCWLFGAAIEEISFGGRLAKLSSVGERWLAYCKHLTSASLDCLLSLSVVDDLWLAHCPMLKSVSFVDLPSLETVDAGWLMNDPQLETVVFRGLTRLQTVDRDWLLEAAGLTTMSFDGVPNLVSVQSSWMEGCSSLTDVSFKKLYRLEQVDNSWLANCQSLSTVSFDGLASLRFVGTRWLYGCNALESVTFRGLHSLQHVSHGWLKRCVALQCVSFRGLEKLSSIGRCWMFGCTRLREIQWTGLSALSSIGRSCLSHCNALQSLRLTDDDLPNLDFIDFYFAFTCPHLKRATLKTLPRLCWFAPKAHLPSEGINEEDLAQDLRDGPSVRTAVWHSGRKRYSSLYNFALPGTSHPL